MSYVRVVNISYKKKEDEGSTISSLSLTELATVGRKFSSFEVDTFE